MDGLIIKYIKKKKEEGLRLLIDEYAAFILAIVKYHLGEFQNHTEECVNDILFSIWENIDKYDCKKNSFKNWIGAISKYKAIDYKRKAINELIHNKMEFENIDINKKSLNDHIDEKYYENLKEEVEQLLDFLNPEDKKIMVDYYLKGYKVEEISKMTGLKTSNLHNKLSRIRKKLRKSI